MADAYNPNSATRMGLEFFTNSSNTFALDGTAVWIAGSFICKPGGSSTISTTKILFDNWEIIGSPGLITAEIYTDSSGNPGSLVTNGTGTTTPASQFTWNAITLGTAATLNQNTRYWIVLKGNASTSTSNKILSRYSIDTGGQLGNTVFGMRTSTNSGTSWSNPGDTQFLCVGVGYSDGTYDGMAYVNFDTNYITVQVGAEWWGERFVPASTINVNSFSAWVKKDAAFTPDTDLQFYIYNVTDSTYVVAATQLATAASVTTSFAKYTKTFTSVSLSSSKTYIAGVIGTDTGSARYQINRQKTDNLGTTEANKMTWGGTTGLLISKVGGSTDNTRDLAFELGLASSNTTTTQTQTGISRITKTGVLQTQTGVANIRNTTLQLQTGISRITKTGVLQTITGIGRITKNGVLQTQAGLSRLTKSGVLQTQTGVANITSAASTLQVYVGTYTGDGTASRAISGLPFQPSVVFIKGGSNIMQVTNSSMGANKTKAITGGTATASGRIISLDTNGFTIGSDASVNSNGTVYYYTALYDSGNASLKVGSYTGNATASTNITTVGFQPTALFILADGTDVSAFKTVDMPTDGVLRLDSFTNLTNRVTAFTSTGFTLGSANEVNGGAGRTYTYIALKDATNIFDTLTYTGNGVDDRNISTFGFQPDFLLLRDGTTAQNAVARFKDESGDNSFLVTANSEAANRIQSLISGGFQIGTDATVNTNTDTYYSLGFKVTTVTTLKTQTGISRITNNVLQTQVGKANIRNNTLQTIPGLFRILKSGVLQTTTGKGRIQKSSVLQTQTGISRITKANNLQTQPGVSRIQKNVLQTQSGIAKIDSGTVTTTRTQTGISRIQKNNNLQLQTGRSRIQKSGVLQTIIGKAFINKNSIQTQTGVANIQTLVYLKGGKINVINRMPNIMVTRNPITGSINIKRTNMGMKVIRSSVILDTNN